VSDPGLDSGTLDYAACSLSGGAAHLLERLDRSYQASTFSSLNQLIVPEISVSSAG
jgi:hypothetical protein